MKKITSIIAAAVLSTGAYANIIMPEMSRDGKTRNDSVIATTGEMRKFIALNYGVDTMEDDVANSVEIETSNMDLYGAWANKMIAVEAAYDSSTKEEGSTDVDMTNTDLKLGWRINNNWSVGLGYGMGSEETGSNEDETTALELAGVYNTGKMTYALSWASNSVDADSNGADGSYSVITLGAGAANKMMTWEAGLIFDLEEDTPADNMDRGSRFTIFGGMTKVVGKVEYDADLSFVSGDNTATGSTDNDYDELNLNFDAEILFGSAYYVTPGLSYESSTKGTDEKSQTDLSVDLGYRAHNFDATLGMDYALSGSFDDGTGEEDFDAMSWNINVAYAF